MATFLAQREKGILKKTCGLFPPWLNLAFSLYSSEAYSCGGWGGLEHIQDISVRVRAKKKKKEDA